MKILYGIQTTGSGHISRALQLAKALKNKGASVDALLTGEVLGSFWDLSVFDNVSTLKGLTFKLKDGKVDIWGTAKQLGLIQFFKDISRLDVSSYDLILNDFEPISAWAGKKHGKTVIGISNQASFDPRVPLPKGRFIDRLVLKRFAPVTHKIGLSFSDFGIHLLPPIIDIEALANRSDDEEFVTEKDHVLVYLPYLSQQKLLDILKQAEGNFEVFCTVDKERQEQNVTLRPLSRPDFLHSLQRCQGLMTHAGFASLAEALHLGIKVLSVPLNGQYEQQWNALIVEQLQLATVVEPLTASAISQWLQQPAIDAQNYPDVSELLANWVMSCEWNQEGSIATLSSEAWSKS